MYKKIRSSVRKLNEKMPINQIPGLIPEDGAVLRGATHYKLMPGERVFNPADWQKQYGSKLHIFRVFKQPPKWEFTEDEMAFIKDGGIIFYSIQPDVWKSSVDKFWYRSQMRKAAAVIKAVAPAQVMVSPGYEPDGHASPAAHGHELFGSADEYIEYRNMVKREFDTVGVTNAIWVQDYSHKPTFDMPTADMIPLVYPTDGSIQYLFFNMFQMNDEAKFNLKKQKGKFAQDWDVRSMFDWFYNYFSDESNPHHQYWKDIPWGVGAWGTLQCFWGGKEDIPLDSRKFWIKNFTEILENQEKYPKIKASIWFDSLESIISDDAPEHIDFFVNELGGRRAGFGSPSLMPDMKAHLQAKSFCKADELYHVPAQNE